MAANLHTVRSADGTTIAFEETGSGPPLVLVHGGVSDRTYWTPVVPALVQHFTVFAVDRRGRGASGDAPSDALEREFADLAAVVDTIGEPVHLVGHSYGGVCALDAALLTGNLRTLTLYEPPFGLEGEIPEQLVASLEALIAAGEPDAAVASFMGEVVGLPPDALAELRADRSAWRPMVDCAHTLPRELRAVSSLAFSPRRYRGIDVPTALLGGTESTPDLRVGIELVHGAIAGSRVVMMDGVDHEAVTTGPDVLVRTLVDVLAGESAPIG
jgi:pimeloyl-ACP methyl ester carboxylesterase